MSAEPETRANRLESLALSIIFAALSTSLFLAIFWVTKSGPKSAGWWTQPWLMPGVALSILALSNLMTLWKDISDLRARPPTAEEAAEGWQALLGWLRPLEFLAYYGLYVFFVQHLGYFPSTLLFVMFLLWRVGLTAPKWIISGLGLVIFMIGVFRYGLGVWMPAPEIYQYFPEAIRTALIRWF